MNAVPGHTIGDYMFTLMWWRNDRAFFINYFLVMYTYLGIGVGGTWGLYEGLLAVPTGESRRLKLNTVINSCTRRGPFLANNLAVLGL